MNESQDKIEDEIEAAEARLPRTDAVELTEAEILSRVLHRDGLMLVIDKPAGLPVHRGPKGGANLETAFEFLRYGLPRAPVLAHRLDRDTSGCLVLGRHRKATASLGLLFKHSRISKTYWAVVEGGPVDDEGVIDMPLGRLNADRGWWMKPDAEGLPAVTKWKVMGRSTVSVSAISPPPCGEGPGVGVAPIAALSPVDPPPRPSPAEGEGATASAASVKRLTWMALEPVTGRTHQLRVHSSASGWPIVGDNIYGTGPRFGEPTLHLHAREIVIPISRNKDPIRVVAPAPPHLHERLRACGWNGE